MSYEHNTSHEHHDSHEPADHHVANHKIEKIQKQVNSIPVAIVLAGVIIGFSIVYSTKTNFGSDARQGERTFIKQLVKQPDLNAAEERVVPSEGVVLPVKWNDLGKKLIESGAIDGKKFVALYEERGTFTDEYKRMLFSDGNGNLKIDRENSDFILNILWALGLANKNEILEKGEMSNPKYGGAGRFASTGGWTLSEGNAMSHYSMHELVVLSAEEQEKVVRVAKGIYRPCCNNSTHFPDCNHGIAMLALLELMASQGISEQEMYKVALAVNSYWFPDTYLTIASYMASKGIDWKNIDPKEVLGAKYSSSSGYKQIMSQSAPADSSLGGSGCGVGAGAPARVVSNIQGSGCGI